MLSSGTGLSDSDSWIVPLATPLTLVEVALHRTDRWRAEGASPTRTHIGSVSNVCSGRTSPTPHVTKAPSSSLSTQTAGA